MSGINEGIGLLYSALDNIATRKILSGTLKKCKKCSDKKLKVALDILYGNREGCFKCRLTAKILKKIISAGAKAFGASDQQLKETFKREEWRRGLLAVLSGIAKFGVEKPFVPGAPFQVVWNITYNCNLRCKHCYASAGKSGVNELSPPQVKKGIDKLAALGVPILAFSGGEPLVRKDIFELTSYAAQYGMYVALATNGTLITREKAHEMKKNGIKYVQISLDGATPETHDSFRGVNSAFERAIKGIKNAVEANFFTNVATTATHYNYKEIPEIIDLCEKLGTNWVMVYNFVPTGRGTFIKESDLTPDEREELLKMLYKKLKTSEVNVLSTAPQFARIALQCEEGMVPTHFQNLPSEGVPRRLAEFIGGCGAGRSYLALEPNGDIQPCVFFQLKIGNILEANLEELWQNNPVLKELRDKDLLEQHCGACEYRYYCGGCRARAYGYFGDYLKADPGCVNNRELYERLTKNA